MKRWALLVVVLYMLALASLLPALGIAAFADRPADVLDIRQRMENLLRIRLSDLVDLWPFGGILAVMGLAQAALLVVPVRLARGRPVSRRWIVWPVIAGVFAFLLLVGGMCLSVHEFLVHTPAIERLGYAERVDVIGVTFIVIGGMWIIWAFVFGFYTGGREPRTFMSRLVKSLVAGSIAELLVAIPAHIVARARNYCCAGGETFTGLAAGVSVMLFAFGPAAFALFVRRVQSLRRR